MLGRRRLGKSNLDYKDHSQCRFCRLLCEEMEKDRDSRIGKQFGNFVCLIMNMYKSLEDLFLKTLQTEIQLSRRDPVGSNAIDWQNGNLRLLTSRNPFELRANSPPRSQSNKQIVCLFLDLTCCTFLFPLRCRYVS